MQVPTGQPEKLEEQELSKDWATLETSRHQLNVSLLLLFILTSSNGFELDWKKQAKRRDNQEGRESVTVDDRFDTAGSTVASLSLHSC
jgi:hypothetical protein